MGGRAEWLGFFDKADWKGLLPRSRFAQRFARISCLELTFPNADLNPGLGVGE